MRAPVTVTQGRVGEDARDRVDVRGLGEFVDDRHISVGQVQHREVRADHEASVVWAKSGSREVWLPWS